MKCETCNSEHDGSYGSGRFCSTKCARSFSTKAKRDAINRRVSQVLTGRSLSAETRSKISLSRGGDGDVDPDEQIQRRKESYARLTELHKFSDVSRRTVTKILKRMKLSCSNCGWYVEGVLGDVHHIVERKYGGSDEHDNLSYLCPNCHRLAHSGIIPKETLITLQDYIGDTWKDFYYVKSDGKLYPS